MDDYRQQQIEALQVAGEYSKKLINGIENVSNELRGARMLDTDQYLDEVVKGINWTIEVVNRTTDILNEKEEVINNDKVNEAVKALGDALSKKDDALIADALSGGILDFVKTVEKATAEL